MIDGDFPLNANKQYKHGLRKRSKYLRKTYYVGGEAAIKSNNQKPCLVIENTN